MKKYRFPILISFISILIIWSCNEPDYDTSLIFEQRGNFLYKIESAFCQSNPDNEIWKQTYKYDANGNKIEEIRWMGDSRDSKKIITYNSNNQPVFDSLFYFIEESWKILSTREYIYSQNLLLEKRIFDSKGDLSQTVLYQYNGSKLEWEEFYYTHNGDRNFQYAYKFEYNRSGQLERKISYQDEAKQNIYDQFVYTYLNGKLSTEKRILITGKTGYLMEYSYTKNGFVEEINKDGNLIEKREYENGLLIKKQTWYYGIDPGYYACNGNLVYKYEY